MTIQSASEIIKQPLFGLKLVVCGYELERKEHRGIAVFSKGLIYSLKEAGAEVWLLTELSPSDIKGKSQLPYSVRRLVFMSRLLDQLSSGEAYPYDDSTLQRWLRNKPLLGWSLSILKVGRQWKRNLFPQRKIRSNQLSFLPLGQLISSPYQSCERLAYLRYIDGIICARDCFTDSFNLAKRRSNQKLQIDLNGFDGIISTSPLNIEPLNTDIFVQTLHDLIPFEYARTLDNLPSFFQRLNATISSRRIFVSKDAEQKYNASILPDTHCDAKRLASKVIYQCPSLHFPEDALDWEANVCELTIQSSEDLHLHSLNPFGFLLFNSSLVPHKNILFALRAFMESGVERLGVKFCITGQPQNDEYSNSVQQLANKNKNIIFTGYVDEATKRHLYLNALALISPSLVEGFGIPVLDAACLGLAAVASPVGSHKEIQQMRDFDTYVVLRSTLDTSDWASAIRKLAMHHQDKVARMSQNDVQALLNKIRKNRILRYNLVQKIINIEFTNGICDLLAPAKNGKPTKLDLVD